MLTHSRYNFSKSC